MKELVANFVQLQEFDNKLNSLKLQKGDLPVLIEHLEEELQDKQTNATELTERISKLQSDRKMFEKEIEASKAQLQKKEDKLYNVQNNKEYDAISLEIDPDAAKEELATDTRKVEIDNLESRIIQTLEQEEELKQAVAANTQEIERITQQLREHREELDEINKHTQEEENRLRDQREVVAQKIDRRYLSQYERIRKAKSGLAVARITRNSCGGCYSAIPPQRIVEIREAGRLHTCEYCGRILVWVDGNGD